MTTQASTSRLHAALDGAVHAERTLQHALRQFITRQLHRALGADHYKLFLPSENTSTTDLLRFIQSKWVGVFADSHVSTSQHLITATRDALLAHGRSKTLESDLQTATTVITTTEALLNALGARGSAARVAESAEEEMDIMDIDNIPTSSPLPPIQHHRIPVVLDGSNIAWAHGLSQRFSIRGAKEAFLYYRSRAHPVALVLPEARLRNVIANHPAERNDYEWVRSLRGTDSLVLTPDSDYDDSYITHLARRARGIIVSNDRFNDQVYQARADGQLSAAKWTEWLAACRVSFVFQGDSFIPNPAFDLHRAKRVADNLVLLPD